MRITSVQAIPIALSRPDTATADQSQEALILRVATDEGLVGHAECNHTPAAARAVVYAPSTSSQTWGIADYLVGRDVDDLGALRVDMLRATQSSSRRGIGLAVLNAVDVALWDLRAQSEGVPLWKALHGDRVAAPEAYATLYTGPGGYEETVERLDAMLEGALALGYRAVKIEPLGDCVPEDQIVSFVERARRRAGIDIALLVDVYHRFRTPEDAADAIEAISSAEPFLIETPLSVDDVHGYTRLASMTRVPLAASELFESPAEFETLMQYGRLAVAQPWPNRMGVTGTLAVALTAAALNRRCILAGWNATPIGIALGVHLAAGLGPGIVLEHAPTELYRTFELRRIAEPELAPVNGAFELPSSPGLGIELDEELLLHYATSFDRLVRDEGGSGAPARRQP